MNESIVINISGERRSLEESEPWGAEENEAEVVKKQKETPPRHRWFKSRSWDWLYRRACKNNPSGAICTGTHF